MQVLHFSEASKYPLLRQPLPNEPDTYNIVGYHATISDFWPQIGRYGLIPGKNKSPGQSWSPLYGGKAIYYHLSFPYHELLNGNDFERQQFMTLVIETRLHHYAGYIVPDEDVSTDPNYTPRAIRNKESIAVGYPTPPNQFICIHLPDLPEAYAFERDMKLRPRFKVKFWTERELL